MDMIIREAPCGYLSLSEDHRILDVNRTLAALLGYKEEMLTGIKIEFLLSKPSRMLFQIYFSPLITLNSKVDEMFLSLHSLHEMEIPVLLNAVRRESKTGVRYDCILFPLNRRIEYEKQLNKAESETRKAHYRLQNVERELHETEKRLAQVKRRLAETEKRIDCDHKGTL